MICSKFKTYAWLLSGYCEAGKVCFWIFLSQTMKQIWNLLFKRRSCHFFLSTVERVGIDSFGYFSQQKKFFALPNCKSLLGWKSQPYFSETREWNMKSECTNTYLEHYLFELLISWTVIWLLESWESTNSWVFGLFDTTTENVALPNLFWMKENERFQSNFINVFLFLFWKPWVKLDIGMYKCDQG